jgi:hypothetical protein
VFIFVSCCVVTRETEMTQTLKPEKKKNQTQIFHRNVWSGPNHNNYKSLHDCFTLENKRESLITTQSIWRSVVTQ